MKRAALALPLCLLHPAIASAQPPSAAPRSGVAVVGALSTLGYRVEVVTSLGARANVRGGLNELHLSHEFDRDGIALDAVLRMRSVDAYVDWFPFGGGFHVSPGLVLYNGIKATAVATVPPGRTFTLGDETLVSNPANPVRGDTGVSFEKAAPAFVVGWGNAITRGARRWSIPVNLGFVYARAPKSTLNVTGSACNALGGNCRNIATDPGLQNDVATERNQLNDDLSWFRVLPMLSVGVSYRF